MSKTTIDLKNLTLKDAFDLAISIEEEAQSRYLEFANAMGSRYSGDAEEFFVSMSKSEAKHAAQLTQMRKVLFSDMPRTVTPYDVWEVEAPGVGAVRSYMSPRQAANLALDAEVKAYQFFDDALKVTENEEVKKLFSELREEEKEHQEMLIELLSRLPESDEPDLTADDIDEPSAL